MKLLITLSILAATLAGLADGPQNTKSAVVKAKMTSSRNTIKPIGESGKRSGGVEKGKRSGGVEKG